MHTAIPLTVLATALACSAASAPAHARARVFVASYGNDANPCTFGSPCKTFQQAVNVVDPGGEVTAIDSAGFGPISITKAVTITSPDGVEAGIVPTAGGNAITINAGEFDAVVLRGLTLDGSGIAFNGIVFNSGGSLTITNCVMQYFVTNGNLNTGDGILIQPTSGTLTFTISNTTASNNNGIGIYYFAPSGSPNAIGVIDHVMTNGNNSDGMGFDTLNTSGGITSVTVSNSIASKNLADGIFAQKSASSTMQLSIDNVTTGGNSDGINVTGKVQMLLGRSVITGNFNIGVANTTSPNTAYSYGDNRINLNGTDISGTALNTVFKTQ